MANLEDVGKQTYLEKHGYSWDQRIESYVNKEEWKIFSKAYIDDHTFDTLLANIQEEPSPGHWKIFTNTESPIDVHNLRTHYGVTVGNPVK